MNKRMSDERFKDYSDLLPNMICIPSNTLELFEALKAEREEVERLQAILKTCKESCGEWADEVERLEEALRQCQRAVSYTGSEEEIPRIVSAALADPK